MERARCTMVACVILLQVIAELAGAGTAAAQDTGGALSGRVAVADGTALEGVRVTVSSPGLIGTRAATTGPTGRFRITSLPGGVYNVRFERLGYRTVVYENVRVALGETVAPGGGVVNLADAPIALDPLVVTSERLSIDVSTPAIATSLSSETFSTLPTERDYRDLVRLVPHANPSFVGDPINVAGATGLENLTFIDGLNVSDPYIGGSGTRLPDNFVREIHVKVGGYEAEYGGAGGGIFNVVTESGGNEWTISGFGYFNNASLTADSRLGVGDLVSRGANAYDLGVAVGGPIAHDRIWLFAAWDPSLSTADVEIPGNGVFEDRLTEHRFASKLSWRAGAATDVAATVFGDPSRHDRVGGGPFAGDVTDILDADVFLNHVERGGLNATIEATHRRGSSAVFDLSLGGQWTHVFDGPMPGDETARYTCISEFECDGLIPGTTSGGFGELFQYDGRRFSARLSGTFFAGTHTPKVGLEYETSLLSPFEGRNPGVGVILDQGPEEDTARWLVIGQERVMSLSNRVPTVYAQDSWAVGPRFRLNYGIRWEGLDIVDNEGSTAQSIRNQWQPRIGFVWEPGAPGLQKVTGSAGRFYQRMPLWLSTFYYTAGDVAVNYSILYDGDPRAGGQPIDSTYYAFCCSIEPGRDLRGMHFDEITVGYERAIGPVRIGARGIARALRQVVNLGTDDDDVYAPLQVGNPGRGDLVALEKPERRYRALELTADWVTPRVRASASYVLSRTRGNYTGLFQSDGGFAFPNHNGLFEHPFQMADNDGLLPNDRTHVFKLWGSFRFDSGLSAGTFFSVESGVPESRYFAWLNNAMHFLAPRGSQGRTPTLWDLSFRFRYPVRTAPEGGWRASLIADFLHVGNPREPALFNQIQTFDVGHGPRANPTFRRAVAYQEPFKMRLGLTLGR